MSRELRIGKWRFDPASGELRCADDTRRLEPRVAQVLEFLAERPNRIVSREELLDGVWRETHVVDAAVWRAVSELRRALDDSGDAPRFIETVPRRGYRLIAPVGLVAAPRRLRGVAVLALLVLAVALVFSLRPGAHRTQRQTLRAQIRAVPVSAAELYETGMRYYRRYRPDDNMLAREMFDKALALDPGFVPARAGLANSLTLDFSRFGGGPPTIDTAIAQARLAVRADPDSAEAHKALGFAYQARGWLGQGAAESHRAIELKPGFAEAIHNFAGALDGMGRPVESLRWRLRQPLENTDRALLFVGIGHTLAAIGERASARRYLELALLAEPYSCYASVELAGLEVREGAYRQAHERLTATLAQHPDCGEVHGLLGDADRARGRIDEARGHYREGTRAFGGTGDMHAWLRLAAEDLMRGDDTEAGQLLERITSAMRRRLDGGDERHEPRLWLAMADALRGRAAAALAALRDAVEHGLYDPAILDREPAFAPLRVLPEFIRLHGRLRDRAKSTSDEISGLEL